MLKSGIPPQNMEKTTLLLLLTYLIKIYCVLIMLYNSGLQTDEMVHFLKHQSSFQDHAFKQKKVIKYQVDKSNIKHVCEQLKMAWTSNRQLGLKDRDTEIKVTCSRPDKSPSEITVLRKYI